MRARKRKQEIDISSACRQYVVALYAKRNAKVLIDIGFETAVAEHRKVLAKDPKTLADAILPVAGAEASNYLDPYEREPETWPQGRSAESALAAGEEIARSRYARGKCGFCKEHAFPCAKRHAKGLSCA